MDLYSNLDVVQTLVPAVYKTAQTGVGVDRHGFHGALVEINCGLWTDGAHVFQVEESDVLGSGYTAVADADLQGTEPTVDDAADDNIVYRIGYKGTKRFIRVTTTEAGVTGLAHGVSVIRGHPRKAPVA